MESATVYMTRDTLAQLAADPRLADFRLSCRAGRGRLDLCLKEGSLPGAKTGSNAPPVTLTFDAHRAEVAFTDPEGRLQMRAFDERRIGSIATLVNAPLGWQGVPADLIEPSLLEEDWLAERPVAGIDRQAIGMLLRHISVRDLLFGSNGRECTLQFQLAAGFAGTHVEAPLDWVGIDFDERQTDLSWFDRQGTFRMSSFRNPMNSTEIGQLFADPLGHVLKNDSPGGLSQSGTGMRALLEKLQQGFAAGPARP